MLGLSHYLSLSGILFAISIAGIFINRKNMILLLMCIELLLLAVNFNFINSQSKDSYRNYTYTALQIFKWMDTKYEAIAGNYTNLVPYHL